MHDRARAHRSKCVCVCVCVCARARVIYSQMNERGRYTRKEERCNSLGLSYCTVRTGGIPLVRDLVSAVTGRDFELKDGFTSTL